MCYRRSDPNEERASHLEISLECADRVIGEPAVSKLLEEPQRSPWLVSACSTLSKLVKKFVYGGSVPTVPDGGELIVLWRLFSSWSPYFEFMEVHTDVTFI